MRLIGTTLILCLSLMLSSSHAAPGVLLTATGGGHYTIPGDVDLEFAFAALVLPNGRAEGNFHHRGVADGELIDFTAQVTCLSVDGVNHRAWIGGVITSNRSTHPQFMTTVHQPGHDIWFRVQDNGPGQSDDTPDVTTIVGFEGVIPSSQVYCDTQPWRTNNVWPVAGNLTVTP